MESLNGQLRALEFCDSWQRRELPACRALSSALDVNRILQGLASVQDKSTTSHQSTPTTTPPLVATRTSESIPQSKQPHTSPSRLEDAEPEHASITTLPTTDINSRDFYESDKWITTIPTTAIPSREFSGSHGLPVSSGLPKNETRSWPGSEHAANSQTVKMAAGLGILSAVIVLSALWKGWRIVQAKKIQRSEGWAKMRTQSRKDETKLADFRSTLTWKSWQPLLNRSGEFAEPYCGLYCGTSEHGYCGPRCLRLAITHPPTSDENKE
ncbi:hypothetical protein EJ04DRAFT_97153 [Polyplosphaeria fusca]|uniref:Uncharacterized protein n=1 Tax=Polyplosphaeria fusca TaxID=682080 RepID=A0A9P4UXS5_9PLEO|nr:hypothetical protein EJ04DRAFT_97153 [Polyplosphaeria fusca]